MVFGREMVPSCTINDLYERKRKAITNFDFLTLREGYDKKELKNALIDNIPRPCYVVTEIKTLAFVSEGMGQSATYIAATDGILRSDNDNPTIGLLICKT